MTILILVGAFVLVQIAVQLYERKSQRLLSAEEKARVLDVGSGMIAWQLAPIAVLLFVFGAWLYVKPTFAWITVGMVVYLLLLATSSGVSFRVLYVRLSAAGLPAAYLARKRGSLLIHGILLAVCLLLIGGWAVWTIRQDGDQGGGLSSSR